LIHNQTRRQIETSNVLNNIYIITNNRILFLNLSDEIYHLSNFSTHHLPAEWGPNVVCQAKTGKGRILSIMNNVPSSPQHKLHVLLHYLLFPGFSQLLLIPHAISDLQPLLFKSCTDQLFSHILKWWKLSWQHNK